MSARIAPRPGNTESFDGVVVVGGGYAGLHALRAAQHAGVPAKLIDPSPTHDFITRLASVAGGSAPVHDASVPFRALGVDVDHAVVRRVDDGTALLDDGRSIEAAALVVATGSMPTTPLLPGLHHAATLRTAVEAVELRTRIAQAQSVVIAGGGSTGVQLAGAVASARRGVEVAIVDPEHELLASMQPLLGRHAAAILQARGVELVLGDRIERIDARGAELGSGRRLDGLVVWAGGFASAGTSLGDDLPIRHGRIEVDPELRVQGWRRTFAAGDVAAHRDSSGQPMAMSAQVAVQAGEGAGRNAARVTSGRTTRPVRLEQRGWVLDLGGRRGVADLAGLPLAAPGLDVLAPILHAAVDAKNLVEIGGFAALRWLPGFPSGGRQVPTPHTDARRDERAAA